MKNEIKVFESVDFGKVRIIEMNGEPWFVGKDVATILGYTNPPKAIRDHVDEEDKTVNDSFTVNGTAPVLINESGLYSLILSSKLQKAKEFKHWVTSEVLPSIRKTGKYSARKEPSEATQARLINAKVRFARELQRLANIETLSPTYKQILIAQAAEALTGVPMELPRSEGKMYSAGEVGKMVGVSANKIGKLANAHGMKTNEFGAWYHDKSPYSSHEVDTFRYNDKAVEKFREIIEEETA
jgi:prophage antirepressor-like protein